MFKVAFMETEPELEEKKTCEKQSVVIFGALSEPCNYVYMCFHSNSWWIHYMNSVYKVSKLNLSN